MAEREREREREREYELEKNNCEPWSTFDSGRHWITLLVVDKDNLLSRN